MSAHSRQNSVVKTSLNAMKDDKIGPWKLGSTLGAGSTGKVLMAQHESTGQQAAVKIVSKSIFGAQGNGNSSTMIGSSEPDMLPYGIEREIIIMKLLNHPNVLRLYDVWETNSSLYMVLEYVEKGELFNLLVERGPLPENEAIRFFRQIIIGISYCHALGIVHRDLKPENLLLDHKFNIKIADFGMAALESKDKLLETSCGSPHYAAPEIVSGLPYHGFESDVWSCGVILFALLTGRLPFDEEDGNIRNLLLKVQSGQFEMPGTDEISAEAQDLISQILTVDPAARIKARGILKHPLLQKHPSIKDSKSIRNLPREDMYLNPLDNADGVTDNSIVNNLVVLWHGRNREEIISKLKEPGANLEKTFYALLHRFKHDSQQDQLKQNRKSQTSPKKTNLRNSVSRRSIVNTPTPKKKTKGPVISASSSHKKPVSFKRLSFTSGSNVENKSPTPSKRTSVNLSSNKRISALINTNSSPTPANKRASLREIDPAAPPIPVDMLKDYNQSAPKSNKKSSRFSKRLSFLPGSGKRGSTTSKLISTYAKICEDNDWEYIEKETRRTSADFATLCDQIFEHEKYEQIRREKEELERRVREAREQEERERLQQEDEERREREQELEKQKQVDLENARRQKAALDKIDQEMNIWKSNEENGGERDPTQNRSVSAPAENVLRVDKRGSVIGLENDIQDLLQRRTFSLETRPVSRLDPGIYTVEELPQAEAEAQARELDAKKNILETIRRSKFLGSSFDITKELAREKRLKEESKASNIKQSDQSERIVSNATVASGTNTDYKSQTLPKNNTEITTQNDKSSYDPRKISEVRVPQFTRRSRHFTASNKRLSVLSMYSTKASFTNLAEHLKGNGDLSSMNASPPSTSKADQEAEFMFENVDKDGKETAETSADSRLYEVAEGRDSKSRSRSGVKLNFADRFDKAASPVTSNAEDPSTIKLPTLPPLGQQKSDGMTGLGLYQPVSEGTEAKAELSSGDTPPANIISMVPTEQQRPEKPDKTPSSGIKAAPVDHVKEKKLTVARQPLEDITPAERKKSNKSFFRKFSSKSHNENKTQGFDAVTHTNIDETQMFNALSKLLVAWRDYGLKDVRALPSVKQIRGKLSSDNILSLRSTLFEITVFKSKGGNGSDIGFQKLSGSGKAFKKLVAEIEKILESKKALVA
ncbi:LANO_0G01486g1_1 [Lachancea nothofagi CBS 11611]|uniref:non-specific serine/threonine protein kinase n=1 Tax=Lachancea nothofagi CBS 11611 TaxID=1266666 RepID=A0A1G4KEU3_9SACH|nr:LANO_0G01486g1_1 [Lachancea nothofagi CBS 11611]